MIWGISATIAAVILLGYAWRLNLKLKKLSNSFKELLQESRKQTPLEQRNKGDIYFHLDQDLRLTYINDVACQFFKTTAEKILNQPILGNFMADTPANLAYLNSCLQKLKRNPQTINNEVIFMPEPGHNVKMKMRIRPVLDEVLNCTGMSIVLRDVSEAEKLQRKLKKLKNRDTLSANILNEDALFKQMEKDFNRCKRYNKDFSLIILELKDIYEFICKGIDFDRGDKLIQQAAQICKQNVGEKALVGRFNKTSFALVMPLTPRGKAAQTAENMYYPLVKMIQQLGVDKYNAEMFVISYTNRKNFSDTVDTMMARMNRHIATAIKNRNYGIKSSDKK